MSAEDGMDEIVHEFLLESGENLDRYESDLLALERDPKAPEVIASIFRTLHTIKGTCGFLGFDKLEALTHRGESLLSKVRDGDVRPRQEMVSVLLRLGDEIRRILANIEATGAEPDVDHAQLVADLEKLSTPSPRGGDFAPPSAALPSPPPESQKSAGLPSESAFATESAAFSPESLPATSTTPLDGQLGSINEQSIRLDVSTLDRLMNLVGELVLARNQTLRFAADSEDAAFIKTTQQLDAITSELQEGVMKTRMQPLSVVVGKFPRVVRDLAMALQKRVALEMTGIETELDRTVLEAIKDPLTHILRNAVDHGIESPEARLAAGKKAVGTILVHATHESGKVVIEISDDGAGIDTRRVAKKAVERGLVAGETAQSMSEQELARMIFLPGFSTANTVTNLSGRGVGMDVVKTNIEKIGGSIDLANRPGQGMTLRLKIPLTLAIVPALIVRNGDDRYAIPQVSLVELLRLSPERAQREFETVLGAKVYRLRDKLLPIVYLSDVLAVGGVSSHSDADDDVQVVVVQADGHPFGLVVDDIQDTQEIVVKPLGPALDGSRLFAGATILGDGAIALILDTLGLAREASVLAEAHDRRAALTKDSIKPAADHSNEQALLLFGVHDEGRMALPLAMVARLEEFTPQMIERIGGAEVVQYRGQIMPLIHVSEAVPERRAAPRGTSEMKNDRGKLSVIVYHDEDRAFGLVVDRILDVIVEGLEARRLAGRPGTLGSAVIQGRVTELLDVKGVVQRAEQAMNFVSEGSRP